MADGPRYAKTPKGVDEIALRRNNLRGTMRTMLILIDPAKSADQLRLQAAQLGAPTDFLAVMLRDGYVAPVGGERQNGASRPGGEDAIQLDAVKRFMHETLAAGPGNRDAPLRARLERCTKPAEVRALVPEYEKAIAAVSGDVEADLLGGRVRKLLGA